MLVVPSLADEGAAAEAVEGRLVVRREQALLESARSTEASLRLIIDNAPSMMAYWDRNLNCVFANRNYERWFGVPSENLVGTNIRDLLGPELFALNKPYIDAVLAGEEQAFERTIFCADGVERHSLSNYAPDIANGEVLGFFVQVSDVSALKKAEASLREAQRLGGVGSWEWSRETDTTIWSLELYNIMGRDPGRPAPSLAEHPALYTPESWVRLAAAIETALLNGEPYKLELQFLRTDGTTGWLEAKGEVLVDRAEKVVGLRGTVQDITTRRALTAELAEQHELLRVTLQSIGDAVITSDERGLVTWLNPIAAQMTGWDSDDARGRPLGQIFYLVHEQTRLPGEDPFAVVMRHGARVGLASHSVLISRDGQELNVEASIAPIRHTDGDMLGAVLVFHDVTEQRRLNNEMSHRARHDGLTGLVNRMEFETRVQRALGTAQTDGSVHALMYIDLDQFKIVNDTCGHTAGDFLLKKIADLLRDTVRAADTVARLGGDEFAILIEHCSTHDAERIAQLICNRMDTFRFVHDDKRFRVGTSIGLVPIDSRWDTATAIMQAADTACYAAKKSGRNRVHRWFGADANISDRKGEVDWAVRLEEAFAERRFRLFAQRIVPIKDCGRKLCFEVLLRLVESDGTVILPGAFLPTAERFRLASRIDIYVLREIANLLTSRSLPLELDTIWINLSGQSIGDHAFHREAIKVLRSAGPAVCQRICLEITETAAVTNMEHAGRFIENVRRLGVRIALDDFGAGAASFGYLKSLPIDVLKVDGQFVQNLASDPLNEAAVRCFVDVARIMGMQVVAKCVETDEVFARLQKMGVDYVQGHLFHKAEPIEEFIFCGEVLAAA